MCFAECGTPGGSCCLLSGAVASSSIVKACYYRLLRSLAASLTVQSLGATKDSDPGCLSCPENVKSDPPAVSCPPYSLWLLHRNHLFFKSSFSLSVHQENYKYTQPPIITP